MRQAFVDAGLLRDPVDGAEHVMAKKGGVRRPVEDGRFFDTPMSPWAAGVPTHKDPAWVLRQNKERVLAGGLRVWLNAATILGIPITDAMKENPSSLKNELRRVLEAR